MGAHPAPIHCDYGGETMNTKQRNDLLQTLKTRFEKNAHRHKGITWDAVISRLDRNPHALKSLGAMEESGGEPDVIGKEKEGGAIVFCDCSSESPAGRRSLCYDREALDSR